MTIDSQIPFQDLMAFPDLFATYCTDYPRLARYYAGNPFDESALVSAIDRTLDRERDRATLVHVLAEQNRNWGAGDDVLDRIDELLTPATSVVVTGQQLGVVGGPLYTQYKTITTIQLAAKLQKETSRPVVPVFWLAGEDHDYDEISAIRVAPDRRVHLAGQTDHVGPVGRIVLDDKIDDIVTDIEGQYQGGAGTSELMAVLRDTFRSGMSWRDAFARYMMWMFRGTGLVIISGDDSRLKRLAVPLFEKAVDSYQSLNDGIAETSVDLAKEFHAQLTPRSTNLFYVNSDRVAVDSHADGFLAGAHKWSRKELINDIREKPQDFSPNVVLRPLYQDTILPTVAYVAGPGETSYFAQLKTAYQWAEVPMPVIYPRASVTILETNISRLLEKEGVAISDIDTDVERMFTSLIKESLDSDIDEMFSPSEGMMMEELGRLARRIADVDPTLEKSTLAIRSVLEKELGKLRGKVVRAEKQRQEVTRGRLTRIVENIYPGGSPQERTVAASYFLARYGEGLIDELLDILPVRTDRHIVINLQ